MEAGKVSWFEWFLDLLPENMQRRKSSVSQKSQDSAQNMQSYRTRERRAAYSAIHFQKQNAFNRINNAVLKGDVLELDDVLSGYDFANEKANDWLFLKHACENEALDVAAVLLRHGADANYFGSSSTLPLHIAVRRGNVSMCALLLSQGANHTCLTKYEMKSPLHFAVLEGHENIIKLLLDLHANINVTDIYGETPLHIACRMGRINTVKLLLEYNADVNSFDKEGWSGLHLAAAAGHMSIVSVLLSQKANIDSQNIYGRTPLSWACANGNTSVVQELLHRGADANVKDINNKLAYQYTRDQTIEKLVLLHTTLEKEPFVSTIGLLIKLDPRISNYIPETENPVNLVCCWQRHTGESHIASSNKDQLEKKSDTMERHHSSLFVVPEEESDNLDFEFAPSLPKGKENPEQAMRNINSMAIRHLAGLEADLEGMASVIKFGRSRSVTCREEVLQDLLSTLRSVIGNMGAFKSKFNDEMIKVSNLCKETTKATETSIGTKLDYIAILKMFDEGVIKYVASKEDGWDLFLKQLPLPSDIRNTLHIRLKMEYSDDKERVKFIMTYWSKNFATLFPNRGSLYMHGVLQCLNKCGFADGETNILEVLKTLISITIDFKPASSSNISSDIDVVLEAISTKDQNTMYNELTCHCDDINLFPDLGDITEGNLSQSQSTTEPNASPSSINQKIKSILLDAVDNEDTEKLAIAVKTVIMTRHEDLLTRLL